MDYFKGMYNDKYKTFFTTNTKQPAGYNGELLGDKFESYKDIKNYIHNYSGLSRNDVREVVLDVVEDTVQKEVAKILNDENRLQSMVEKEILRQLKCQDKVRNSFIRNTMDGIYNKIDEVIHEEVVKRLQITLKEENDEQ